MQGGIGIGGAIYAARKGDMLTLKRERLMREMEKKNNQPFSQQSSFRDSFYNNMGTYGNQGGDGEGSSPNRKQSPVRHHKVTLQTLYHKNSDSWSPQKQTNSLTKKSTFGMGLTTAKHFNYKSNVNQIESEIEDFKMDDSLEFEQQSRHQSIHVLTKKQMSEKQQHEQDYNDLANNPVRKGIVWLVDWKYFEYFIITMIILNSATLVMYDYNDRNSDLYWNQIMDNLGLFFTIVFALECALKIIAFGFIIHRKAYLRIGWNLIDFAVVISGLLEILPGSVRLKSLRVLRVLRPLRSINAIPGLKKHVTALIQSIPDFVNVIIFLLFIFLLFAILGTHQYMGVFYNQCRFNPFPESPGSWAIDPSTQQRVCSKTGLGVYQCPNNEYCGNPSEYNIDLSSDGIINDAVINYGIVTFDNVAVSLLTVFQIVTTDGWTPIMLNLMDADIPFLGAFYCVLVIIVGSYFLMNLILAVIIQAFINIQKKEIDEQIQNLELKKLDPDMQELQDEEQEDQAHRQQDQQNVDNMIEDLYQDPQDIHAKTQDEKQEWDDDKAMIRHQISHSNNIQDDDKTELAEDCKQNEYNTNDNNYNSKKPMNSQEDKKASALKVMQTLKQNKARRFTVFDISQKGLISMDDISLDKLNDVTADKSGLTIDEMVKDIKSTQLNEQYKNVDFSFLKPMAMKRKVVDIFSKTAATAQHYPERQIRQTIEEDLNEDDQVDTGKVAQIDISVLNKQITQQKGDINKQETQKHGISYYLQQIAQEKYKQGQSIDIQDQDIEPAVPEQQKLATAFKAFLDRKLEEQQSKEEFFNDLLQETKDQYLKDRQNPNQPTSLRQLASLRLSLQIKRQNQDLSKVYDKFKIEHRAEKNKLYYYAYKISQSVWFSGFISLLIIINTVLLSLDKYPEDDVLNSKLDKVNILFTVIFILEMLIKQVALGLKSYFIDPFNSFDCIIVLSSVIDLFVSNLLSSKNGGAFTALRAFRLLRIFKLAKSWQKLQQLLKTMWKTLKDVSTFSVLLFLFIFLYALLGMEMFGFKVKLDSQGNIDMVNGTEPDSNFDNFLEAFTTVFVVLTNDGWSGIYYTYYRGTGGLISTIYFISLIIIGQKILLNLFLAILLENFDEDSLSEEIKQQFEDSKSQKIEMTRVEKFVKLCQDKLVEFFNLEDDYTMRKKKNGNRQNNLSIGSHTALSGGNQTARITPSQDSKSEQSNTLNSSMGRKGKLKKSTSLSMIDNNLYLDGKSLYIFSMHNKFRQFIFDIVTDKKFDYFIILAILVSGVQLALENPLNDPNGQLENILYYLDTITTSIFAMECLLKIIAFGLLLNGKPSYLRNPWNMLDFVIIIFSVLSLTPFVGNIRIIKILRVSRPLRLISRNKGLKVAVFALAKAIPSIANVTIITLLFFLIFGIISTSYFKGKLYYCNTTGITLVGNFQVNEKWECLNTGGTWMNSPFDFDNILDSVQTMFQISSTSGWSTVMYASIAATEIDYVMVDKNNFYWAIFFIAFIIVGTFFLLNLFVGVVISTFNREKDKIGGNNLLTDRQKEWIDTRLLVINSKPQKKLKPPQTKIQVFCFELQNHRAFETFIFICIIINTLVLTLKWFEQPSNLSGATDIINYVFTAIFALEAIIKILALGKIYFNDGWNIFDFIIVIGSFISVILTQFTALNVGGATTIVRAFRVSRVFRLVKKAQSLRLVFNTFIVTLPALANVGGLLLLLLYLYSVLGVYLFAQVKRNGLMTDILNFENFWNAFLTLFIISTGDAWDQIVDAFTQQNSITYQCISDNSYQDYVNNGSQTMQCGLGAVALVYFYSYILLVNLIFLNLFIAIILQGFEDTQRKENRMFNNDSLSHFRKVWSDFDPEATTFIPIAQLRPLLFKLGLPLGFDKSYQGSKAMQDKFIISLDLPTYNNFTDYQFLDVLDALSLRLMVHENFIKAEKEEQEVKEEHLTSEHNNSEHQGPTPKNMNRQNTTQREENFKEKMRKEINKLKFNDDAMAIDAVQQVQNRELKLEDSKKNLQKDNYFTSLHQAAAEVAFNHMRYVVAKRKLIRKIESMEQNEEQLVNQLGQQPHHSPVKDSTQAANNQQTDQTLQLPRKNTLIEDDQMRRTNFSKSSKWTRTQSPVKAILQKEPKSRQILEEINKSRKLVKKSTQVLRKMQSKRQTNAGGQYEDQEYIDKFDDGEFGTRKSSASKESRLDTSSIEQIIEQEMITNQRQGLTQHNLLEELKREESQTNRTDRSNILNFPSNQFSNDQVDENIGIMNRQQHRTRLRDSQVLNAAMFGGSMGGTGECISEEEKTQQDSQLNQASVLANHERDSRNVVNVQLSNQTNINDMNRMQLAGQQYRGPVTMINMSKFNPLNPTLLQKEGPSAIQNNLIQQSNQFTPNFMSDQLAYREQVSDTTGNSNYNSIQRSMQIGNQLRGQKQQQYTDNSNTRLQDFSNRNIYGASEVDLSINLQYHNEEELKQERQTTDKSDTNQYQKNSQGTQRLQHLRNQYKHLKMTSSGSGIDAESGNLPNYQPQIYYSQFNRNLINNNDTDAIDDNEDYDLNKQELDSPNHLGKPDHNKIERRDRSDISQIIQQELTKMLSIPKNQKYLSKIEEAEDNHELENIRQDIVNDDEFMQEIQKVIEVRINTSQSGSQQSRSIDNIHNHIQDSIQRFQSDDDEIQFDDNY